MRDHSPEKLASLVGKPAHYGLNYENLSPVVSTRKLYAIRRIQVLVLLENGTELDLDRCYFDSPIC